MTLKLLKDETAGDRLLVLTVIAVSGISNAAILAIINVAATGTDGQDQTQPFFMFLVAILLFVVTLRFAQEKSAQIFEGMVHRIRLRISEKISGSELQTMERLGRGRIYNRLIQDTETLSRSRQILVAALQSAALVLFVCLYIAYLSVPAFLLTTVMTTTAIGVYVAREKEAARLMRLSSTAEDQLMGRFTELLNGFKQVKMRQGLSRDLLDDIRRDSYGVKDLRIATSRINNHNNIFAQSFFYLLIGAVVFILPLYVATYSEVLSEVTAAILFIIGPLSLIASSIPVLNRTDVAAANIRILESDLDRQTQHFAPRPDPYGPSTLAPFEEISAHRLAFSYGDPNAPGGFSIGPLNLELTPGKLIFITGGNGCGKSTLLKVLTGLYPASAGSISIDGVRLTPQALQEYRELFAVIFGDFTLFKKLYGLQETAAESVNRELRELKILDKTSFDGETFSDLDLSTGQRKRVALAVAKLEKRPIFVLDEWAADQDPQFREHFYTHILPSLKAAGKTVIAVTHDDRFHDLADDLVKMEYGQIVEVSHPASAPKSLSTGASDASPK